MRVSPAARPPNMKARCEIDLSPGRRTRPESAGEREAVAGTGAVWAVMGSTRKVVVVAAVAERGVPDGGGFIGERRLLTRVSGPVIPRRRPGPLILRRLLFHRRARRARRHSRRLRHGSRRRADIGFDSGRACR